MKKSVIYIAIGVGILVSALTSCKPTESNYRAAYDAAKAKREAAVKEQMLPASGMLSDDGPQLRVVNGDSIYVLRERLRYPDSRPLPGRWALAVGVYKMDTNAEGNVESLRHAGYPEAFVANGPGDKHYAVTDCYATLDSARVASRQFKLGHTGYPYVGLPGAPVIVGY